MQNNKLNMAILGLGRIAEKMATALNGIKDEVNLYAVASRSQEKADSFASKWGFEKAYGSYEELAKDDQVDLVYIATPHSEHFNNASLCVNNGRNCLVEKAFCANLDQTERLIKLAKSKDVFLAEAMWTRYMPSMQVLRDIIDGGRIGKIVAIDTDFSIPISHVDRIKEPALAGGALLDLGVYSLTIPEMILGLEYESAECVSLKLETGVDATDIIRFIYKDATATVKCSVVDDTGNYAKIVGEKGYIYFDTINNPKRIDIYNNSGELVETIDTPSMINGYEYEVLECKKAILNGDKEAYSMTLEKTLDMMEIMDKLREEFGVKYPFE